ncbi:IS110 family transposase [Polaribacter cellanae]|uniref:IS110 family transposase n=1 Tax=Polaribacter cellanae TaxID=2818493 RepID=A0A975CL99_9FLAO|nr:IS110 family transposase [Polaribacter cellanae]QTE21268.1 IS110 family transposase [Polaribacter cellanae]QTE21394.1 IS110 family transposase [Polaribacter cellanae]QTE23637.1 IS110 family transposase [Polaribacter cellanae]QTE23776.1 IS110 family transposase [Polaribacter cellanae]
MDKVIKQVVGIDVSCKKFDVCFQEQTQTGSLSIKGTRSFSNDLKGFKDYLIWFSKRKKEVYLVHIMEATGVYHENLCYFLFEQQEKVSVQLAQKIKYFGKSLHQKTKTDKADAKLIALFGFSFSVALWEPISEHFQAIKDLCRMLSQLKKSKSATQSQLHAFESKHGVLEEVLTIMNKLLVQQEDSINECEKEIKLWVSKDKDLEEKINRITAIKGIQMLTVVKLLAETDGFRKCSSIRKLVSYAGLDVVENQSGTKSGRTRISKKGNSHIREALYMPALCASRFDQRMKTFYKRLNEKQNTKKQGVIAVMRKLLIVIYTLWKNEQQYNPEYQWK